MKDWFGDDGGFTAFEATALATDKKAPLGVMSVISQVRVELSTRVLNAINEDLAQ